MYKKWFFLSVIFSVGALFAAAGDYRNVYFKNETSREFVARLKRDATEVVSKNVMPGGQIFLGKAEAGDAFAYLTPGSLYGQWTGTLDWDSLALSDARDVLVTLKPGWSTFYTVVSAYEGHVQLPVDQLDKVYNTMLSEIDSFKTDKSNLAAKIETILQTLRFVGVPEDVLGTLHGAFGSYSRNIIAAAQFAKEEKKDRAINSLKSANQTLVTIRALVEMQFDILKKQA